MPWTKPDDFEVDGMKPADGLGGLWSGGVFLAAFADGSVRTITKSVDPEFLKAMFTISGREAIGIDGDVGARPIPPEFKPDPAPDAPVEEEFEEQTFEPIP